jgi:hypothetical protein
MNAAPAAGVLGDSFCADDGNDVSDRPLRKRKKEDEQPEHQKDKEKKKEPIFMCLGQLHHPSSFLIDLTPTNYKEVPYFSAKWSPEPKQAEDPIIAMIARAVQALFGIHVHPFPVDFVAAFKPWVQPTGEVPIPGGCSCAPLWVLCYHIMDHVVHKKEMSLAFQVELKDEYIAAAFLVVVKKFVSHPDRFGFFLSHFLHHLLAEWIAASSTKSERGSSAANHLALMQSLLSCSLIKWTLFYDRATQKETTSFNDPSLFCHCVHDYVVGSNSNNDVVAGVRKCSALYGFAGDEHTIFHHCLLLHPAILDSLSGPLSKSPSIQTFIQKDPCSIYWFTIGTQISAALYFDLYQLLRRGSKRYSQACIVRSCNEGFWWLLQSVSETPAPEPVDFPWTNQDLFFPCIFGFGPHT